MITVAELQATLGLDARGFNRGVADTSAQTKRLKAGLGGIDDGSRRAQQGLSGVGGSAAKAGSALDRNLTGAAERFRGSFGPMIAAGAATAGAAVVAFAYGTAKSASDLQEQLSATGVTFGAATDRVVAFSKTTADALGMSQTAALQSANTFGAFFDAIGVGAKTSADLSVGLVQLSGDIASFRNAAGGAAQVAQDLRSGLSGESEPLRKYGIFLTEATTKNKALELGLGGVGRELTEGEKILARYAFIMEKSSNAHGDFARTSDSLANQQRVLAANVENLRASLGKLTAPTLAGATGAVNDMAKGITGLLNKTGDAGGALSDFGRASTFNLLGPVGAAINLKEAIDRVRFGADANKSATERMTSALATYQKVAGDAGSSESTLAKARKELQSVSAEYVAEQNKLVQGMKTEAQVLAESQAKTRDLRNVVIGNADAKRALTAATRDVSAAQATQTERQKALGDLLRRGAVDARAVAAATRDVTAAQKGAADAAERLTDARSRLAELESPSADTLEQRTIDLARARDTVAEAEENLAKLRAGAPADARDVARGELRVEQATEQLAAAQADTTMTATGLRVAQLELADAQADLNRLLSGGVASARELSSAELSLQQAKLDLRETEAAQVTDAAALATARRDVTRAEEGLWTATEAVNESQAKLREAQAGDPDFQAKVAAGRDAVTKSTWALDDAQWAQQKSVYAARDAADALTAAWKADETAIQRVRWEMALLRNEVAAGLPAAPGFSFEAGQGPTRRAIGGPVKAGTPYLVGESGRPELFVPDVSGVIDPLRPGGAAGGGAAGAVSGGGDTYHITIQAGIGDPVAIGEQVERVLARAGRRGFGT